VRGGPYAVCFTQEAEDDLNRLTDFLLDRAQDLETLNQVEASVHTLRPQGIAGACRGLWLRGFV